MYLSFTYQVGGLEVLKGVCKQIQIGEDPETLVDVIDVSSLRAYLFLANASMFRL